MIQIDLPMPKSCCECQLKTVEEGYYGEVLYYCPAIKAEIRGKKRHKRRYRRCPLIEVKEDDMTKDEILVIKVNTLISPEAKEQLRKSIIKQKETGVVILPYFAEAIIAPKDIEIKMEDDGK